MTEPENTDNIRIRDPAGAPRSRPLSVPELFSEQLLGTLRDPDAGRRARAVHLLGDAPGPEVAEALLTVLGDEDCGVRQAAASALGKIGDPRAIDGLLDTLGDDHPQVRQVGAWALSRLDDLRPSERRRLTGGLVHHLDDPDPDAHAAVARAVAGIGGTRSLGALLVAFHAEDLPERRAEILAAARAAAPTPDVVAIARAAARDNRDPGLRRLALEMLLELGEEGEDELRELAVTGLAEADAFLGIGSETDDAEGPRGQVHALDDARAKRQGLSVRDALAAAGRDPGSAPHATHTIDLRVTHGRASHHWDVDVTASGGFAGRLLRLPVSMPGSVPLLVPLWPGPSGSCEATVRIDDQKDTLDPALAGERLDDLEAIVAIIPETIAISEIEGLLGELANQALLTSLERAVGQRTSAAWDALARSSAAYRLSEMVRTSLLNALAEETP